MNGHDEWKLANPEWYSQENQKYYCKCGEEIEELEDCCNGCMTELIKEHSAVYVNRRIAEFYASDAETHEEFCRVDESNFFNFCENYKPDLFLDMGIETCSSIEQELRFLDKELAKIRKVNE